MKVQSQVYPWSWRNISVLMSVTSEYTLFPVFDTGPYNNEGAIGDALKSVSKEETVFLTAKIPKSCIDEMGARTSRRFISPLLCLVGRVFSVLTSTK